MNPKEWFVTHFVLSLLFSIHHLALNMLTTSHLQSLQKIIKSNLKIILYQPNKVVFKTLFFRFYFKLMFALPQSNHCKFFMRNYSVPKC